MAVRSVAQWDDCYIAYGIIETKRVKASNFLISHLSLCPINFNLRIEFSPVVEIGVSNFVRMFQGLVERLVDVG